MCVICHAAKKRHMKRLEVIEAMCHNSAGFFMAALQPNGKRDTIRTLDYNEALAFFDKVNDDTEFVMHARIPSYGPKSLDNVHGWEEDGIIYCHNMSLHNIDGFRDKFPDWKDKTDSEFFFKKLFIPYYRGLGKDAYKDGKMHPDLHSFVDWICGSGNKFLFIMPDNRVIRFGQWVNEPDRKEGDEIAFWASNGSYKVFERSWPQYGSQTGGRPQSGGSFPQRDPDDFGEDCWEYDGFGYGRRPERRDPPGTKAAVRPSVYPEPWTENAGQTLRCLVGDAKVLRCALANLVVKNLLETRRVLAHEIPGEDLAAEALTKLAPAAFDSDTYDAAVGNLGFVLEDAGPDTVGLYAEEFAGEFQKALVRSVNHGFLPAFVGDKWVADGLRKFDEELRAFMRVANLSFDWTADSEKFATAFFLTRTRTGRPKMEEIGAADLVVDTDGTYGESTGAIDVLLEAARAEEEDEREAERENAEVQKGVDKANGKGAGK